MVSIKHCKGLPMAETDTRRSVEELAQSLYEASDPGGIAWVKRGRVICDAWLHLAQRIAQPENGSADVRRAGS
jgi:hypothetical protein